MGERKYKTADEAVEAMISSTGVLHVNSTSLMDSTYVQEQIEATNRIMDNYKKRRHGAASANKLVPSR